MFFRNTTQVDLPWKKAKILLHSENEEIEFLKESSLTFPSPSSRALSALVISMETAEGDGLLDKFQALNCTCCVLAKSHFKEKNQKRFSQTGI